MKLAQCPNQQMLCASLHEVDPVISVLPPHGPHDVFTHFVQRNSIRAIVLDCAIANLPGDGNSLLCFDLASNVAVDEVMLAAYSPVPRLVLGKVVVVCVISSAIGRCYDMEDILICLKQAFPPQHISILPSCLNKHTQSFRQMHHHKISRAVRANQCYRYIHILTCYMSYMVELLCRETLFVSAYRHVVRVKVQGFGERFCCTDDNMWVVTCDGNTWKQVVLCLQAYHFLSCLQQVS